MKTIKLTGKIMHCRFLLLTDVLHIPDLILKLFFLTFFKRVTSLTTDKMVPGQARAMERITNLSKMI